MSLNKLTSNFFFSIIMLDFLQNRIDIITLKENNNVQRIKQKKIVKVITGKRTLIKAPLKT
jgi:hypothetical protein